MVKYTYNAFKDVVTDTVISAGATLAFSAAGKIASKYVDTCLSGKYLDLNVVDEFLTDVVYQPKYVNQSSFRTIITENVWDVAKSVVVDMMF